MVRLTRVAAALTSGLALQVWSAPAGAQPAPAGFAGQGSIPQSQRVDPLINLQLKVRRLPDAIELIIEGTGPAPQLQQSSNGASWQGQLFTAVPSGLRVGPQRLSLPEVGLQSVSFDGGGQSFALSVTPLPGINLGRPVVSADGRNLIVTFASPVPQASLQTSRPNLAQPGAVPLPTFAPPLQPRAVAPPLGDMAVGTMTLRNPGYLELPGPPVTMTLKNAPAKDALMALAQVGGYGFAYVAEPTSPASPAAPAGASDPGSRPISLTFRGESFGRAFNTALLAAGLQGKREGRVILAGPNALSKTFGPQLSKIYRLNQVGPNAAADYLANLGASVTKTNTITTAVTQGVAQGEAVSSSPNSQTTQSSTITNVEAYGASSGPLLGLRATTDTRLGTITLVGDPAIVSIAEQYLKKLDLRQRQVALTVQILDVNLDNAADMANSFAVRWGNNFIVNDNGQLLGAFGDLMPPGEAAFDPLFGRRTTNQGRSSANVVDALRDTVVGTGANAAETGSRSSSRSSARNSSESSTSRQSSVQPNPGLDYPKNNFFNFVRAQIVSGSTKLLASPTLILQENPSLLREGSESGGSTGSSQSSGSSSTQQGNQGIVNIGLDSPIGRRRANEGVVRVGTNVVTAYETETPSQGGNVVCTPELSTAGLVLGARVEKIDDNGFVTFVLSPSVSAITDREPAPQGCGSDLNILSIRSLDTGALRVRDGQTLILTGVISDFDRQEVSKWPILGDIPLIGQFFRATTSRKEKRELVIMVTPRIVDDEQGGIYGYGYQPSSRPVRDFLGGQGF
ncbi:MAG: general secretion pathway protein D [Cyanobium sp. M30B3]|nr:MAG: general secretion pathway protein D [Cyanobium sp. M30B3]